MKLLKCLECYDVFSLSTIEKTCTCGKTKGKYTGSVKAQYSGDNVLLIGIDNESFEDAVFKQRILDEALSRNNSSIETQGVRFEAFLIPINSKSINKI